jgi:hypothetical protein
MQDVSSGSFSDRLSDLTAELRLLDRDLKSNPSLNRPVLREFRQTLDDLRMTAWTVQELLDARQAQEDPKAVMSFLTAERLRRSRQMLRDLCTDLSSGNPSWPIQDIKDLESALITLQECLDAIHRAI